MSTTLVFTAGRRVWRVRALLWLSMVAAAASVYWGLDLYRTYGLRPADGGVLASHGVRLAWLVVASLFGLACAAGMWVYSRVYVAALWLDEAAGQVAIQTAGGWRGSRTVLPLTNVRRSTYHDGGFWTPTHSVRAPWHTMRVEGGSWPFVVDAQGTTVNPVLLKRVLSGGRR